MANAIKNDEIDLVEVFFSIFKFIKKNIVILVISGILGATIGFSSKFFTKEYFKSEMIIESYTISEELRINYINQFNNLLEDKSYEYLSENSSLSIEELMLIKKISAKPDGNIIDEEILFINIVVWDYSVLPKIAEGLQSYMNSFTYVKNEIELFKENSKSLIRDIEKYVIDSINPSNRNYYVNNITKKDKFFHNEVLDLLREKIQLEKELNYALPFRIIQDFTIYKNPVNKVKKNSMKGALILFFITFLTLIIIQFNKKIN